MVIQIEWQIGDEYNIPVQGIGSPEGPSSLLYLNPKEVGGLLGFRIVDSAQFDDMI